jgi:hypothetical protein
MVLLLQAVPVKKLPNQPLPKKQPLQQKILIKPKALGGVDHQVLELVQLLKVLQPKEQAPKDAAHVMVG